VQTRRHRCRALPPRLPSATMRRVAPQGGSFATGFPPTVAFHHFFGPPSIVTGAFLFCPLAGQRRRRESLSSGSIMNEGFVWAWRHPIVIIGHGIERVCKAIVPGPATAHWTDFWVVPPFIEEPVYGLLFFFCLGRLRTASLVQAAVQRSACSDDVNGRPYPSDDGAGRFRAVCGDNNVYRLPPFLLSRLKSLVSGRRIHSFSFAVISFPVQSVQYRDSLAVP